MHAMILSSLLFYSADTSIPLSQIQKGVILDAAKKVKEISKSVSSQHKDMHSLVSKVGKSIDKVRM